MKPTTPIRMSLPLLLTVYQAATHLQVSARQVRRLTTAGPAPAPKEFGRPNHPALFQGSVQSH